MTNDELTMEERLLLSKNVVSVDEADDGRTVLRFDDGTSVTLEGQRVPLDDLGVPVCSFCGAPPDNAPLYTDDGKLFICRRCVGKAFETFLQNGVTVPLHAVARGKGR